MKTNFVSVVTLLRQLLISNVTVLCFCNALAQVCDNFHNALKDYDCSQTVVLQMLAYTCRVMCIYQAVKDKDKDAFIGLKELVSHMVMIQTKDKLFHHLN